MGKYKLTLDYNLSNLESELRMPYAQRCGDDALKRRISLGAVLHVDKYGTISGHDVQLRAPALLSRQPQDISIIASLEPGPAFDGFIYCPDKRWVDVRFQGKIAGPRFQVDLMPLPLKIENSYSQSELFKGLQNLWEAKKINFAPTAQGSMYLSEIVERSFFAEIWKLLRPQSHQKA